MKTLKGESVDFGGGAHATIVRKCIVGEWFASKLAEYKSTV